MFKIYANGNFIDERLGYANALELATKTKKLYSKKSTVTIEDIKGRVIDTL